MKKIYVAFAVFSISLTAVFLFYPLSHKAKANGAGLTPGNYKEGALLVKFKPEVKNFVNITAGKINLPPLNALNDKHGLAAIAKLFPESRHSQDALGNIYKLQFPAGQKMEELLADYGDNPLVEYAEPDYYVQAQMIPNDPLYSDQWNFEKINMPDTWEYDSVSPLYGGDPTVIVAVLDTGVAYENYGIYQQAPDFAETNFAAGYDFVNIDAHANDDNSHGTHVAGTIAESTDNGLGAAGIAFNVTIMPVKVLGADGNGLMSDVAQGIDFAAANGAKIINMSLGGNSSDLTLQNAVSSAQTQGVIMVAATGNESASTIYYPARYDGVIAVGATGASDEIADYSNHGTGIDLVAPGGNGINYIYQQTCTDDPACVTFDYVGMEGTSMATPHVSGVAALLISYGVDPNNVQNILQTSAQDLGTAGYDTVFGYGRLDVFAAFQLVAGDIIPPTNPTIAAYDTSATTVALTSGGRYSYPTPYFEWSGATDSASGIDGYYYYFGPDSDADPEVDGVFTADTNFTAASLSNSEDSAFYFKIKTKDQANNVTASATQFEYIFDALADSVIIGAGPNGGPQVRVMKADGSLVSQFFAYSSTFRGGVNVAVGDLDGDGKNEIITGSGPGGGPQVRVFDKNGVPKFTNGFFAYASTVRNGVYVAAGDLNGDGKDEIITGTGAGSGPHVRTFNRFGSPVFSPGFFAYASTVRNGVYVAAGDLNGDGKDEIITGTGAGSGPHVRVFNYIGTPVFTPGFFAYASTFRGGVRVATAELNADGKKEIITSPGIGGGPQVRAFNRFGIPTVTNGFFAFDPGFTGGTFLAGGDTNQDGIDEIIVSIGSNSAPLVRVFNQTGTVIYDQFYALAQTFTSGINIASGIIK